ncbi:MAG: winged helix-turn-helix transcriptional regulator [Microthrixaceae bacterium]|jgi:DNA-binding MarR family transcriptional regulator|nr:winged helix-turn-helix transcriptional regulator [Microthrixaceae bacterium]MCB0925741.1 winged helix-turn-helix transcriptional regulator [Mycobacterium sp.]MCB0988036.1 winged helix-turn-helix transcriptional regulator [Acidimicrobiales bacterium]
MPGSRSVEAELDAVTDAVLLSSRALVAVASRSIASVDESVTLPQFRALVVLDRAEAGLNVGELARELRIQPSTATRLCDRLVRRRLARRRVNPANRREVTMLLTAAGRDVVAKVTRQRRREIASIMAKVPASQRVAIIDALTAFREAAGEDDVVPSVPW